MSKDLVPQPKGRLTKRSRAAAARTNICTSAIADRKCVLPKDHEEPWHKDNITVAGSTYAWRDEDVVMARAMEMLGNAPTNFWHFIGDEAEDEGDGG